LVQLCHGATGFIPFLCLLSSTLKRIELSRLSDFAASPLGASQEHSSAAATSPLGALQEQSSAAATSPLGALQEQSSAAATSPLGASQEQHYSAVASAASELDGMVPALGVEAEPSYRFSDTLNVIDGAKQGSVGKSAPSSQTLADKYKAAAVSMGNVVWQRGLVLFKYRRKVVCSD
jgi:hypothetical protein